MKLRTRTHRDLLKTEDYPPPSTRSSETSISPRLRGLPRIPVSLVCRPLRGKLSIATLQCLKWKLSCSPGRKPPIAEL